MNKKGFTLIELLAVIIILGILMIIAIPSVTKYISDSRKSAYIDTAKEIISGARNLVNEGKLGMFDTSATYYLPYSCISTENASKSPYGDFTNAYVIVKYNGKGYDYYWRSVDDAGQGIKDLTKIDDLDVDSIESDLNKNDVSPDVSIPGTNKIVLFNEKCTGTATTTVDSESTTATTTDNKTWTYKDMKITIELNLSQCDESGNYKICHNASLSSLNIGTNSKIKDFVATFQIPSGAEIIASYDQDKMYPTINGNTLKIEGNKDNKTWLYLEPNGEPLNTSFQIKIPKDVDFKLTNGVITYNELISDTQTGTAVQGDASNMYADLPTLRVELRRLDYWGLGGGQYREKYDVYVTNNTSEDITNWSFVLEIPEAYTNVNVINPLLASASGRVYTFSSTTTTIQAGQTIPFEQKLMIDTTDINAIPDIR